jgi:uncharacterized protein YndB with AHSA1/START domain
MTIAPVVAKVTVKALPDRAFELFSKHISDWWEKGKTIGKNPHVDIVIEPKAGGRWFERDAAGVECPWGKVLAWEPPHRLLLGWQLNSVFEYDPNFLTEVELTFVAQVGGSTLVTLEHRDLERFGADAVKVARQVGDGWPKFMADFATYADTHKE